MARTKPGKLLIVTRQLLTTMYSEKDLKALAEKVELPLPWLKLFFRGKIDDPTVNRIEILYEYLTKKPLIV